MSGQTIQVLGATDQTLSPAATPKMLMLADGTVVTTSGGTGTTSSKVQGADVAGATAAGNPLQNGYVVQTTPVAAGANGQVEPQQGDAFGGAFVVLKAPGTNLPANYTSNNADGVAPSANVYRLTTVAYGTVFDGVQWNRARGDTTGTYCVAAPSTGTDRSITATTTSQQLMAANTSRHGFYIKNDTLIVVWINIGATAAATAGGGNIAIAAGGYYESPASATPTGAVNIIAASTTAAVTAREL